MKVKDIEDMAGGNKGWEFYGGVPEVVGNPTGCLMVGDLSSTCSIPDDWSIDYGEPSRTRIIHPRPGPPMKMTRCGYCNRRCPSDEYECAGCGAPT